MDAVVDRFVVGRQHEKAIKAGIASALLVGDGLLQVQVVKGASKAEAERFYRGLCSPTHHFVYGDIGPEYFVFNNPESACRTCGGLGVDKLTHPELLVPDPRAQHPRRLLRARGVQVQPGHLGRARDVQPGEAAGVLARRRRGTSCPSRARNAILYGIEPKKVVLALPPDAKVTRDDWEGKEVGFDGIARRIERHYRRYRQRGEGSSGMEAWLDKVMVEHTCPDCKGARVRRDPAAVHRRTARSIHDVGQLHFDELHAFLGDGRAGRPRRPTPAARCSRRSAAGWSCSWASAWTT